MPTVALLGPQRRRPTVAEVADGLEIAGPLATVTAGWEEREDQDAELRDHLGGRTVNLALYRRTETVFAEDPELLAAWRERQDRLREAQELYRLRLGHTIEAARELAARSGGSEALAAARRGAVEGVRQLDREHFDVVAAIHDDFERAASPVGRPSIARQRDEIAEKLDRCAALAVAGGHVAVLLNRLRLFGVIDLAGDRPVLAWSAGAMALAGRVVVFHDQPPQGAGNAEVLERGLAAFPGVVPFPHARRRLRLDDPRRVALLAVRMAPERCVLLDEGDRLFWNGSYWSAPEGVRWLEPDGRVVSAKGGLPE